MLNKIKNIKLSSIFLSIFLGLLIIGLLINSQANAAKILQQEEFYRIYQMEKQDLVEPLVQESMINLAQEITSTKNMFFCSDLVNRNLQSIGPNNDIFLIAQDKQLNYLGWIIFKKINESVYLITSKAGININNFDLGKNLLLSITKASNLPENFKIVTKYAESEKEFFESLGFKHDPEYSRDTNRASLIAFNQSIIKKNLPIFRDLRKTLSKKLDATLNCTNYHQSASSYKLREKINKRFFIQEIAPYIPEMEVIHNKIIEIKQYCFSEPLLQDLHVLEIYLNECADLINKLSKIYFPKTSPIHIIVQ